MRPWRLLPDPLIRNRCPYSDYPAFLHLCNISNINVGFLVKSSITVVDVTQYGKSETITNPTTGSVSLLNDRPPLVLRAKATLPNSTHTVAFTVIVNHLRSLDSIDDPASGPFVRLKRQLPAEFLANLIQARQAADPNEIIITLGDFNAYQFNDGYVDVTGTVIGKPSAPGQDVLSTPAITNPPLSLMVNIEATSQQYSYTFSGSAEELDQFALNPPAMEILSGVATARLNADFPEAYRGDFSRPEPVSDHDWLVGYFNLPPATLCNGAYSGTYVGNLTVSAGQTCIFVGGGVTGNIMQSGGELVLAGSTVGGNVQVQGGGMFSLSGGTSGPTKIGGNLQVQNLPASTSQNQICNVTVSGNVEFQNNQAPVEIGGTSMCPGNVVHGNLQVQNNTAAAAVYNNIVTGNLQIQNNTGSAMVFGNGVSKNLLCDGNTTISGGGNTAHQKQGQCVNY
jgi:hypothetical protein